MIAEFSRIGLTEQKAKETIKNKVLSKNLSSVVAEAGRHAGDLVGHGALLYNVAAKVKPQVFHFMPLLVSYICTGKIDSEQRLNAAIEFLTKMPPNKVVADVDVAQFEASCGVGVVVTPAQIEEAIEQELAKVHIFL